MGTTQFGFKFGSNDEYSVYCEHVEMIEASPDSLELIIHFSSGKVLKSLYTTGQLRKEALSAVLKAMASYNKSILGVPEVIERNGFRP